MNFITFIVVYPLLQLLSYLPLRILYILSDFFFFILYYVVGYRKKVVENNIRTAFPEKKDKEVRLIAKKFFNHFTDLIFESVKSFTISEKQIKKRYTYKNLELIHELTEKGRSIVITGAHHNNWELSFGLPLQVSINCYGAYTKINNPYFEKYIKSSRMRFGYDGERTYDFKAAIQKRVEANVQSLYVLLSDQSPQISRTKHWANFFGQYVPVHTGAEILAKKYDFAVVNMAVTKLKRGYYQATFELITDDVQSYPDYTLTEDYLKITEKHIRTQPECYLWSHKRFKHVDKYEEWLTEHAK